MVDIAQVFTICSILDAMMIEHEGILKKSDAKDAKDVKEDDLRLIYEAFFIFAGMWAIGGCFGGG
jgi:dynein heavy chain